MTKDNEHKFEPKDFPVKPEEFKGFVPLTEKEEKIFLIEYEIFSSVLATNCSINWIRKLLSKYFAWKVNKKYERLKWRRIVRKFINIIKEEND